MKISVFGSGYVGLVTSTCFAELDHHVICVDVDEQRIAKLKQGHCPIFEPDLEALLAKNLRAGNVQFTTDAEVAIKNSDVIFIAVGTPPNEDGSADLKYVMQVAKVIGTYMDCYKVIVDKSTAPVGTTEKVADVISEQLVARKVVLDFDVVSNPEFLREGKAIADCMNPDRIVVGTSSQQAADKMRDLYHALDPDNNKLLIMDEASAEMTKYVANALLATKISFMNEMSQIADKVGADIEQVRIGIGMDHRIGPYFIYPGCGYGGSCFPKDVQALQRTAHEHNCEASILTAVHQVNEKQKLTLVHKILKHFNGDIKGKTFAIWGLAFKPNTDDIREASSLVLIESLLMHGASVQAYDPVAMANVAKHYPDNPKVRFFDARRPALEGADALVVVTEWDEFRSADFNYVKSKLKQPVIFDGRNIYQPKVLKSFGFTYYSIGRKPVLS